MSTTASQSSPLLSSGLQFLLHCAISLRTSHARRTLGKGGVAPPLLRSLCLDSQRMNTATQLLLQSLVHQTVALYQRQTLKLGADNQDTEMGFRARGHSMHVAFIVDLQVVWLKCVGQFGSDSLFNGPARVWIHLWSEVGQRAA